MDTICHQNPMVSVSAYDKVYICSEIFVIETNMPNNLYLFLLSYNSIAVLNCFCFNSKLMIWLFPLFCRRCFFACCHKVSYCKNRMRIDHFWSRIFHYLSDFSFHFRLITMDLTFTARGLVFPKWALERSLTGIGI